MQLYVKVMTKTMTFDVESSETLKYLKSRITDQEGVPVDQQKIFKDKSELTDDDKTLADYGVVADTTLHMVMK